MKTSAAAVAAFSFWPRSRPARRPNRPADAAQSSTPVQTAAAPAPADP